VTPEPASLAVDAADRELALSLLARYAPPLAQRAEGGRVFCDAYAPDRLPVAAPERSAVPRWARAPPTFR
jgi:hypothetical protein